MRGSVLAWLIGGVTIAASWAQASPWTLPRGNVVLQAGFSYGLAEEEYLDTHQRQDFPLNGQLSYATLQVGARAGLTDRLEIELSIPLKFITYTADPVILLNQPPGDLREPIDYFQDNTISLSQNVMGLGDINVVTRFNLFRRPWALTIELNSKIPTGYSGPAGTFGESPKSTGDFLRNIDRFVQPSNVRDDVTLGDGQFDLISSILLGISLPYGTFIRASSGYNWRTEGAGDQIVGDVRSGKTLGQHILVYANLSGEYSVTRGRQIGISVAAFDPNLPATEFGGVRNLFLRELTLDRDELRVGGGLIIRANHKLEANIGYQYTILGRNTSAVHNISIGIASSFFSN